MSWGRFLIVGGICVATGLVSAPVVGAVAVGVLLQKQTCK